MWEDASRGMWSFDQNTTGNGILSASQVNTIRLPSFTRINRCLRRTTGRRLTVKQFTTTCTTYHVSIIFQWSKTTSLLDWISSVKYASWKRWVSTNTETGLRRWRVNTDVLEDISTTKKHKTSPIKFYNISWTSGWKTEIKDNHVATIPIQCCYCKAADAAVGQTDRRKTPTPMLYLASIC